MSFNFSQDLLSQMTSNSQIPMQSAPTNSQMSTHLMAPTSNSQMSTHLMTSNNSQMSTHLMEPIQSQMSTNLMASNNSQMLTHLTEPIPQSQLATSSQDNTWCSGDSQSLISSQQMNPVRNDQMVPSIVPKIIAAAEQVKKNKYTAPKWTNGLLKSTTDKKKADEMMRSMSQDLNFLKNQLSQMGQIQANQHENSQNLLVKSLKVCFTFFKSFINFFELLEIIKDQRFDLFVIFSSPFLIWVYIYIYAF